MQSKYFTINEHKIENKSQIIKYFVSVQSKYFEDNEHKIENKLQIM